MENYASLPLLMDIYARKAASNSARRIAMEDDVTVEGAAEVVARSPSPLPVAPVPPPTPCPLPADPCSMVAKFTPQTESHLPAMMSLSAFVVVQDQQGFIWSQLRGWASLDPPNREAMAAVTGRARRAVSRCPFAVDTPQSSVACNPNHASLTYPSGADSRK